jgi:hypothetical protein
MNIFGYTIISNDKLHELEANAEAAAKSWVASEADKVVAQLKTTHIGAAVVTAINDFKSKTMTGSEKFAGVLGQIAPLVLSYAMAGGVPAAIGDVEDLARQLIQSTYNDLQTTGVGKLVTALKGLLGL